MPLPVLGLLWLTRYLDSRHRTWIFPQKIQPGDSMNSIVKGNQSKHRSCIIFITLFDNDHLKPKKRKKSICCQFFTSAKEFMLLPAILVFYSLIQNHHWLLLIESYRDTNKKSWNANDSSHYLCKHWNWNYCAFGGAWLRAWQGVW